MPNEKAEILDSRLQEKELVGRWNVYALLYQQGTGFYKLLFTGW
jgi:hypothetical protein